MRQRLSRFLDVVSEYLAHRKGLLPLLGIALVIVNLVLQFVAPGWALVALADSNLFLHLGVIVAVLGVLLAWAL